MFNLEEAIKAWEASLRKNRFIDDGDVEELESHMRELIHEFIEEGASEELAFERALNKMGDLAVINSEMYKIKTTKADGTLPDASNSSALVLLPNYIKTAFRLIKKNPVYSSINITGLATGLACFALITIYLQYQRSFDSFHEYSKDIYRLNKIVTPQTGGTEFHALSSGAMAPQLMLDYPEIKETVRIRPWFSEVLMSHDEQNLVVDKFVLTDSSFFTVFDFELLEGDEQTALTEPLSMVISEEVAGYFFGTDSPVGKSIKGLNGLDYTITGVVVNTPDNSHLEYDVLVSWSSTGAAALDFPWLNTWLTQAIFTYVVLEENVDPTALEAKFPGFMETHFSQRADQYSLYLEPFEEIYLQETDVKFDDEVRSGSANNVYIFSAVALLVLLIACINFINLTTARSVIRGREVGVRKVLGAKRGQLGFQYLGESLLFSFLAMFLAIVFVTLAKPLLLFIGVPERLGLLVNQGETLLLMAGITFLVGMLSGIYPAVVLSGFKPVETLYNRASKGWKGDKIIRKALVTLQFSLSIVLIVGTLAVYQQMEYVSEKDLGFNKEQVLILPIGKTNIARQGEAFRQILLQHSSIDKVAASNTVPGLGFSSFSINPEGQADSDKWVSNLLKLNDDEFLETYGMQMKEGRFFSKEFVSDDSSAVIINEAMAKSLGWSEPIGKRLDIPGELEQGTVIGVIKDFNAASLYQDVDPLVLIRPGSRNNYLSIKVNPANLAPVMEHIRATWKSFDPAYPFEFFFLDETFDQFYASEQRMLSILALLSGLAIFVACLGLFGLSTFMVLQRKKEIGIRKVLGSSVLSVLVLISKGFIVLVAIGFLVATPIAFWLASGWLNQFAYRIELGLGIFLISGLVVLILATVAILWQAIKAALANPVNSLKSD